MQITPGVQRQEAVRAYLANHPSLEAARTLVFETVLLSRRAQTAVLVKDLTAAGLSPRLLYRLASESRDALRSPRARLVAADVAARARHEVMLDEFDRINTDDPIETVRYMYEFADLRGALQARAAHLRAALETASVTAGGDPVAFAMTQLAVVFDEQRLTKKALRTIEAIHRTVRLPARPTVTHTNVTGGAVSFPVLQLSAPA